MYNTYLSFVLILGISTVVFIFKFFYDYHKKYKKKPSETSSINAIKEIIANKRVFASGTYFTAIGLAVKFLIDYSSNDPIVSISSNFILTVSIFILIVFSLYSFYSTYQWIERIEELEQKTDV